MRLHHTQPNDRLPPFTIVKLPAHAITKNRPILRHTAATASEKGILQKNERETVAQRGALLALIHQHQNRRCALSLCALKHTTSGSRSSSLMPPVRPIERGSRPNFPRTTQERSSECFLFVSPQREREALGNEQKGRRWWFIKFLSDEA